MRRLQLDFLRARRAPRWPGYVLLVVAVAFAADVGYSYQDLSARAGRAETSLAGLSPSRPPAASAPALQPGEIAFARETVRHLSTPWDRLFKALEAAHGERIALVSIEPDAAAGTVTVTGEARDYFAALSYVANLSAQEPLRRVHLVRHEAGRAGGLRPLRFTVQASWREGP